MARNKGISNRGYSLSSRQINLFPSGTIFYDRKINARGIEVGYSTHISERFRPLGMKSGVDYSRHRGVWKTQTGARGVKTTVVGKTNFPWISRRGGAGGQTMTMAMFKNHLMIASYEVVKNSHNFAIILSLRAQKIFQQSFKYRRFYSAGASKWPDLTENTMKRRIKNGTWPGAGGILREFGDMYKSIKQRDVASGGQVYTDPSEYKPHTYKNGKTRRSICYAGIHNNGWEMGMTYGTGVGGKRAAVPVKQRQFMGHSTYLFNFANSIMGVYLFDEVFLTAKRRR